MKILLTALVSLTFLACGGGSSSNNTQTANISTVDSNGSTSINNENLETILQETNTASLNEKEIEDLYVLREEEKLAHDVYTSIFNIHGKNIFKNIANSEQTHTNAVLSLINHYNLQDPVGENIMGVFENQTLQTLHDDLVAKGTATLLDGYIVGATVEDLDIQDIEDMKQRTSNENILLVYESLQKGSRNHLRSFMKQVELLGGTYTPQYISQEMFDSIINSDMETGK